MQYQRLRPSLLAPALIAGLAAACGSSSNDRPLDASPAPPSDSGSAADAAPPDGTVSTACQSPFTVTPDQNAEANATAALLALSPTATMTWAPARGTLSSIQGLVVELPTCTGSVNAYDLFLNYLAGSPALFQIDPTEWSTSTLPCSEILANGFHTLVIHRVSYGPFPLDNDVFSVVADVQNGTAIFRNFSGVYIPPPTAAMVATLQGCHAIDVLTGVLSTPFSYQIFAPPPAAQCTAAGVGSYTVTPADTVTLDPAVRMRWEESSVVTIHPESTATLVVAPANYTAQLEGSDANCTDLDGNPHIGWVRTFDAFTGNVLYDHRSPDPYCTVCLK